MKKYALLVAATGPLAGRNYMPDATALLNSIQKIRLHERVDGDLVVYLLHYGFDPSWNYFERACKAYDFKFVALELDPKSIACPAGTKTIELIKRARYFKLLNIALEYDAVCLMDADMFFVAPEFGSFFQMVAGTKKLIGANERFKWDVGPQTYFEANGTPIFSGPRRMYSMICNVPSIFDMHQWYEVFKYYKDICFNGYQIKNDIRVGIGDLFAHNISIHKFNRESDVIMFPMECMAQVHHVWRKPWTHLINDNGHWRSFAGDRVYVIHDTKRIAAENFVSDNMRDYQDEFSGWKSRESMTAKIESGLNAIKNELNDLTCGKDAVLNLNSFKWR